MSERYQSRMENELIFRFRVSSTDSKDLCHECVFFVFIRTFLIGVGGEEEKRRVNLEIFARQHDQGPILKNI